MICAAKTLRLVVAASAKRKGTAQRSVAGDAGATSHGHFGLSSPLLLTGSSYRDVCVIVGRVYLQSG